MKFILKMALTSVCAVSLAACGGDKADKADVKAAMDEGTAAATKTMDAGKTAPDSAMANFTKADYIKACSSEGGLTKDQCQCTLDFYEGIGMDIKDMNDTAKMTAAMENLKPEQMMDMAKCMQ